MFFERVLFPSRLCLSECDMWLPRPVGDHARVSDIVNEVERRDLRDATARLLQEANSDRPSASEADVQQQPGEKDSSSFTDDQPPQ
jgi:hypothetical protein